MNVSPRPQAFERFPVLRPGRVYDGVKMPAHCFRMVGRIHIACFVVLLHPDRADVLKIPPYFRLTFLVACWQMLLGECGRNQQVPWAKIAADEHCQLYLRVVLVDPLLGLAGNFGPLPPGYRRVPWFRATI